MIELVSNVIIRITAMDIKEEPVDCNLNDTLTTNVHKSLNNEGSLKVYNSCIKQEIDATIMKIGDDSSMNIKQEQLDIKEEELLEGVYANKDHVKSRATLKKNLKYTVVKRYACSTGTFKAVHKQSLIKTRAGEADASYFCNICEFTTSGKGHLKHHIKKSHREEKPYACSICDFRSTFKRNLRYHMYTHTGECYACHNCDFKTAYKYSLKSHLKIHTTIKQYTCNLCEYKTSDVESLNFHTLIHPYLT